MDAARADSELTSSPWIPASFISRPRISCQSLRPENSTCAMTLRGTSPFGDPLWPASAGALAHGDDEGAIAVFALHRGQGLGVAREHGFDGVGLKVGSRPQDRGGR